MGGYRMHAFHLPAAQEDPLCAELWARGALGCQVTPAAEPGWVRVEAYFADPEPPALAGLDLERWRRLGVAADGQRDVPRRDWLADYRARSRPFELGSGFVVDPGDLDADDSAPDRGRRLLRLPAQTAFGTGSHESTRLVVEWLEELDPEGLSVLDVGTGSGILAFVAERLGARSVVGYDVDPAAVCIARQNARLNGCRPALFAGGAGALEPSAAFDLALVNVLPERVLGDYPALVDRLGPGGRLVSSGNLVERRAELLERFAGFGLQPLGEKRQRDWLAFLFVRVRPLP